MVAEKEGPIVVDPQGEFKTALIRAGKKAGDLTIPLTLISQSWYKTNKALFTFTNKGPFKELSPMYQIKKDKRWGFIWPILKASGALEKSLTIPTDGNTIASILNKKVLILGTKVTSKKGAPYPSYLNEGTSKMPARPFMVIGTEKGNWSKSTHIQRRLKLWIKLLNDYVISTVEKDKR